MKFLVRFRHAIDDIIKRSSYTMALGDSILDFNFGTASTDNLEVIKFIESYMSNRLSVEWLEPEEPEIVPESVQELPAIVEVEAPKPEKVKKSGVKVSTKPSPKKRGPKPKMAG